MAYRKFRANKLFTGHKFLDNDAVLVTDENGSVQEIVSLEAAGDAVESFNGILCPGFINTHCHLELSHMKGMIPPKSGMISFLLSVMKHRDIDKEIVLQAMAEAESAMLDKGIVAVGDICNTTDTLALKKQGNLLYHNFIEALGFVGALADQRFEIAHKVFLQFASLYNIPAESNSIVPHSPYSVSAELFQKIVDFPGNHLLTIHNQESEEENEFFRDGSGDFLRLYKSMGIDISFHKGNKKTSLQNFANRFYRNQSLILVHNVHTNKEDLEYIDLYSAIKENLYFCLCPNANLYINERLPDLEMLVKYSSNIVIGTDSLASNHQLDILEELKTLQKEYPSIETVELLKWATINGANALQLSDVLGSFEPGKQPGIVLIRNADEDTLLKNADSLRVL